MKKFRNILLIVIFLLILLTMHEVQAKDYSIEKIDMVAELMENGNLKINESITYNFRGQYNGVYITIPYGLDDSKYNKMGEKGSVVKNSYYNASSYEILNISQNNIDYEKVNLAYNGSARKYTIEKGTKIDIVKIYSPSEDETKTFNISYVLNNIAVRHNDVGELYYNFIGGEWDKSIKELNIDIKLPNNTRKDTLYAFGHGPYNGEVTIKDQNNVNLYIKNVPKGKYVAGRLVFDLDNIKDSKKESGKDAFSSIMQQEKNIYNGIRNKDRIKNITLILSIILLIYWLVLILLYEKENRYAVAVNDEELFKKYNPLIAGCIQGSRNVLPRDIIAVILELVNKKYLKMRITKSIKKVQDNYNYYVQVNPDSTYVPDEVENYILNWLRITDKTEVELIKKLNGLSKLQGSSKKFKELDKKATEILNNMGANKSKVPVLLKIFNNLLFIIGIVLGIINIANSNIFIETTNLALIFIIALQCILYGAIFIGFLFINIIYKIKNSIDKHIQKLNGQKITSASITIVLIVTLIMTITAVLHGNSYILVSELIIGVTTLIMLTDDLMMKNDAQIILDYNELNLLKQKIQDYSMMKEKEIKEVVLWEKYLTYAISFGIATKISKHIKPMVKAEELSVLLEDKYMYDYMFNNFSYLPDVIVKTSGFGGSGGGLSDGFSGGSGGGFFGGGSFSGGGGRRRSEAEPSKSSQLDGNFGHREM